LLGADPVQAPAVGVRVVAGVAVVVVVQFPVSSAVTVVVVVLALGYQLVAAAA